MSKTRISFDPYAVNGELLEAFLTAYMVQALPSALFSRLGKAAACAATALGTSDPEGATHWLDFSERCGALRDGERSAEDEKFHKPPTR